MHRQSVVIAWESGMGIDSSGEIFLHALMNLWYRVSSDREFPSLIKWWDSQYIVSIADEQIASTTKEFSCWIGLWKSWLEYCLQHCKDVPVLHNFAKWEEAFPEIVWNDQFIAIPTRKICDDHHVGYLFENTIMLWAIASAYGIPYEIIEHALKHRYGKKEAIWAMNKKMLKAWYDYLEKSLITLPPITPAEEKRMLIDGNTALWLWAIHAWVRTYFAYPMSPSTSVLLYLASVAEKTWMMVKQVEDEITAIQMNIGASYAWSRSFTCTSGWWFDLMTESISLSWMTEVPCVVGIAQRPGPATWLPTWTAQWDLNLAIHAGHGEFARIVVAVSDARSAFDLMQYAFDFAELYQVPVIVLTEKVIADNRSSIEVFNQRTTPLERWLVTDSDELASLERTDRYKITDSWVSKRWLPTSSETTYFCNGDEHKEDGTLDESEETKHMIAKRIRKLETIQKNLPPAVTYGDPEARIWFIGRWSTKNAMLDCIAQWETIAYCHIEWLWPLKKKELLDFMSKHTHICVVENNATGQLANLIQQELGITITNRFLKWNWRQITMKDITDYIASL